MRTHYRFGQEWQLQARADAVLALLRDVPGYERWWPGVRVLGDASTPDARGAHLEVRAPLGYRIRVTITEQAGTEQADTAPASADQLRVAMTGDLEGWATWRVRPVPGGTRVLFAQEVEARRPLLRALSPLLHNRLAAQHNRVMRDAEQGMRTALITAV